MKSFVFQSFHCNGPVVLDEVDSLIKQMEDIQFELEHPGILQAQLLSGLLTVLLIKLQRKFKAFKHNDLAEDNNIVTQFNMLIDSQDCHFRFVKEYANQLHISTTYLNDLVKKITGLPASFWINKKQITYSKQLLSNQSLNFQTISSNLGLVTQPILLDFLKRIPNHPQRIIGIH